MAQKTYNFEDIGKVTFYKRRGSKSIRIRINGTNVKVTLPIWVPYRAAIEFVNQRKNWILSNKKSSSVLYNGVIIGQNYQLSLQTSQSTKFRLVEHENVIKIYFPEKYELESDKVQNRIEKYITNILKRDAEDRLIPLARKLAETHDFTLNSLEVKKLKSRWGSCNSKKDVVLNLYLVQLPQNHIEYVIFHELAHTVHLNHGKEFWKLVEHFVPDYKKIRKEIKTHSPDILISRP